MSSVDRSESGASEIVDAFVLPPAHEGADVEQVRPRHAEQQDRGVAAQSATCSMRSRNVSSPQWMSSNTTTRGRSCARISNRRRIDQKVSSGAPPSPAAMSFARLAVIVSACSSDCTAPAIANDGRLFVEIDEAQGLLHRLGDGEVGDVLAVRQASALQDLGAVEGREGLLNEALLPRAGGAQHREQLTHTVRDRPLVRLRQQDRLALAPDHRRVQTTGAYRRDGRDLYDAPRRHRLGLALRLHRLDVSATTASRTRRHVGSPINTSPGAAADCSREAVFIASPMIGASSAGTSTSPVVIPIGPPVGSGTTVQRRESLLHLDAGADRPESVVFVGDRQAEDGHDRIADELLHAATVALDC